MSLQTFLLFLFTNLYEFFQNSRLRTNNKLFRILKRILRIPHRIGNEKWKANI